MSDIKNKQSVEQEGTPLVDNSEQLLRLAALLEKQNAILTQMDWKLWVMMNTMVDGLIHSGAISAENDPRKK